MSSRNMITYADIRAIAEGFGRPERTGKSWRCECPICGSHTLDLTVGKRHDLIVMCWHCQDWRGIWEAIRARGFGGSSYKPSQSTFKADADWERRIEYGLKWKRESEPIAGTPAETYLATRGLRVELLPHLPRVLSFHPRVKHPSGAFLPALIAPLSYLGSENRGAHITFLKADGSGKADIDPPRATYGPAKGAGVFLGPVIEGQEYIVGEGIESTLSAMVMAGRSLNGGVSLSGVAALSAVGMESLVLRPEMKRILIASDLDKNNVGQRAARIAFDRWKEEGREVRVAYPRVEGTDFNDMLLEAGPYQNG